MNDEYRLANIHTDIIKEAKVSIFFRKFLFLVKIKINRAIDNIIGIYILPSVNNKENKFSRVNK